MARSYSARSEEEIFGATGGLELDFAIDAFLPLLVAFEEVGRALVVPVTAVATGVLVGETRPALRPEVEGMTLSGSGALGIGCTFGVGEGETGLTAGADGLVAGPEGTVLEGGGVGDGRTAGAGAGAGREGTVRDGGGAEGFGAEGLGAGGGALGREEGVGLLAGREGDLEGVDGLLAGRLEEGDERPLPPLRLPPPLFPPGPPANASKGRTKASKTDAIISQLALPNLRLPISVSLLRIDAYLSAIIVLAAGIKGCAEFETQTQPCEKGTFVPKGYLVSAGAVVVGCCNRGVLPMSIPAARSMMRFHIPDCQSAAPEPVPEPFPPEPKTICGPRI